MCFILPQKLFSFARYLSICPEFTVIPKNNLIRKLRLISKFMMSQPTWLINNRTTHDQYLKK